MALEQLAHEAALDEVPNLMHPWARPRPRLRRPPAPGQIGRAPGLAVWVALGATVVLLGYTLEVVRLQVGGAGGTVGWLAWQSPLLALALIGGWWARRERDLGLALRLCALLPLVHVGWLVFVQGVWSSMASSLWLSGGLAFAVQTPSWQIVVGAAACLALALPWRRVRTARDPMVWLGPLFALSVGFLWFLGLWLPVAADLYADRIYWSRYWIADGDFVALVLVPPAVAAGTVAAAVTLGATRWAWVRTLVMVAAVVASGISLAVGTCARVHANEYALHGYANFIPALACAAAVTLLCAAAIGVSHWRALRGVAFGHGDGASQPIDGVVVALADGPAVGRLRYQGWLRGFRMEVAAFVLRTRRGEVPVPAGARLITPLPPWSTSAAAGEAVCVLRAGDRVSVVGLVDATGDGVYRGGGALVAGARGVVVTTGACAASRSWRELMLASWRPVVLYVIATGVALVPGLAGLFAL